MAGVGGKSARPLIDDGWDRGKEEDRTCSFVLLARSNRCKGLNFFKREAPVVEARLSGFDVFDVREGTGEEG